MKTSWKKNVGKLGIVAFGSAMLMACGSQDDQKTTSKSVNLVKCYGVAKTPNQSIVVDKKICEKLSFTKQEPIPANEASKYKMNKEVKYTKCFGVNAAKKNDCATNTTSCAGTAKNADQADAWVSIPLDVCKQLKGASVGKEKA